MLGVQAGDVHQLILPTNSPLLLCSGNGKLSSVFVESIQTVVEHVECVYFECDRQ